jgi:hypothetical protein
MDIENKISSRWAALLGISFIIATCIASYTFFKIKTLNNNITVAGLAERVVTSDTAKWSGYFTRRVSPSSLQEGNNEMTKDWEAISAYLHAHGIKDEEISLQPISRNTNCATNKFGYQDCTGNGLVSYDLMQYFTIESNNVEALSELSQSSTQDLGDKGILFTSQGLEFYYSKLADLRVELTEEATHNAKIRAEKIANTTGSKIGYLQSADVSVIQVTQKNSTDISDYGTYDTTSLDKKITLVVHATFSLR